MRKNGTLVPKQRPFTTVDQRRVLAHMRDGMSLSAAATTTGWSARSVRAMISQARAGNCPALVGFADQVDAIRIARARPKRNGNGLSPAGHVFLAELDLETERDLRRAPGRQPWPSSDFGTAISR